MSFLQTVLLSGEREITVNVQLIDTILAPDICYLYVGIQHLRLKRQIRPKQVFGIFLFAEVPLTIIVEPEAMSVNNGVGQKFADCGGTAVGSTDHLRSTLGLADCLVQICGLSGEKMGLHKQLNTSEKNKIAIMSSIRNKLERFAGL